MHPLPPVFGTRHHSNTAIILLATSISWAGCHAGFGHELFSACIQHHVTLKVDARYLDITIQLTFFEDASAHERDHMDTDHDQRVSRSEMDRYLAELETKTGREVTLLAGGAPIALTPLYAPKLDLLGNAQVGRGHHRLTLYFFGTTPAALATDTEFILENRLWPGFRPLTTFQVEGYDGARLEVLSPGDPNNPPPRQETPRELRARLLVPPALLCAPGPQPD